MAIPRPTAPLDNGGLLWHWHHILTHYLPGIYTALERVQGLLITTHIREVAVEMRRDIEEKALSLQTDKKKRIPDLLGSNLSYLLRLVQVASHEEPPPCVEGTREVPKVSTSDDA